ncbi:MAG TPA: hypothetical protein VH599_07575 [Ktedonobacterales bacterium]|jgi:hypothetical protein
MSLFVHLTSAGQVNRIRRSGIKKKGRGVFCMPVLPNYYISHQWVRELKRSGQRTMVAIYFSLSPDEPVEVGRYNQPHQYISAGAAIKVITESPDPEGFEVIVPRSIGRAELHRVRAVPQGLGWRYFPHSHQRKPCLCRWCLRGDIKAQRLRRRAAQDGARDDF